MRPFLAREKIRHCLLEGVYEQNLVILGLKAIPRRVVGRTPVRRGLLAAAFLVAMLLGQVIPLNPLPWRSTGPQQELAAESARPQPAEPSGIETAMERSAAGGPG